jgi:A-kinase anchor protein 13
MSLRKEDLLQELQEASRLAATFFSASSHLGRSASSVGEKQSEVYETPALPKRAETFGGFDADLGRGRRRSGGWVEQGLGGSPALLGLDKGQQVAAVQLAHHLNNILCMVSEHFTSLQGLKVGLYS